MVVIACLCGFKFGFEFHHLSVFSPLWSCFAVILHISFLFVFFRNGKVVLFVQDVQFGVTLLFSTFCDQEHFLLEVYLRHLHNRNSSTLSAARLCLKQPHTLLICMNLYSVLTLIALAHCNVQGEFSPGTKITQSVLQSGSCCTTVPPNLPVQKADRHRGLHQTSSYIKT